MLAARPLADLALTTNGVLLADQADALQGRRPAPDHGQPRHAQARSLRRAHPLRRARRGARGHGGRPTASSAASRSTRSSSAASTTTSSSALVEYGQAGERRGPLHRVHGRRRRHALVGRPRRLAARDPRAARRRATAPIEPVERARRPRRPIASAWPTAPSSGSSRRRPSRSAASCDRSRLTADGMWYLCLYAASGIDLRAPLRAGASADELRRIIAAGWEAPNRPRRRTAPRARRPAVVRPRADAAEGPAPRNAHEGRIGAGCELTTGWSSGSIARPTAKVARARRAIRAGPRGERGARVRRTEPGRARARTLPRLPSPRRPRARVRVRGGRRARVGALRAGAASAALPRGRRARPGRRRARPRRFLYADLFGLRDRDRERQSLFRYYHGRSSLTTWLRAVLAQRHVDRLRASRRTEPLPDEDSSGRPARRRPGRSSPNATATWASSRGRSRGRWPASPRATACAWPATMRRS